MTNFEINKGYAGILQIKNGVVFFRAKGGTEFLKAQQRIVKRICAKLGNIYVLNGYNIDVRLKDNLTKEEYNAQIKGIPEDIESELEKAIQVNWYSEDVLLKSVKNEIRD